MTGRVTSKVEEVQSGMRDRALLKNLMLSNRYYGPRYEIALIRAESTVVQHHQNESSTPVRATKRRHRSRKRRR